MPASGDDPRADPRDATKVTLGAKVYGQHCAACHGANLEGHPDWRRRLPNGGRLAAAPALCHAARPDLPSFILVDKDGTILWRADYGGAPKYHMYVPVRSIAADLREGLRKAEQKQ